MNVGTRVRARCRRLCNDAGSIPQAGGLVAMQAEHLAEEVGHAVLGSRRNPATQRKRSVTPREPLAKTAISSAASAR